MSKTPLPWRVKFGRPNTKSRFWIFEIRRFLIIFRQNSIKIKNFFENLNIFLRHNYFCRISKIQNQEFGFSKFVLKLIFGFNFKFPKRFSEPDFRFPTSIFDHFSTKFAQNPKFLRKFEYFFASMIFLFDQRNWEPAPLSFHEDACPYQNRNLIN